MLTNLIFVLACSGRKRNVDRCDAKFMYTGAIFLKGQAIAEAHGIPYKILSAKYGLIDPTHQIDTYNERFKGKGDRPIPREPLHGFYVGGQDYFSRYPEPRFKGLVPQTTIGYMLQNLQYLIDNPDVARQMFERKQRAYEAAQ
jgi:hypothetical protein